HFGHHAGHGLGLTHPEAPFFVAEADETLLENDVVTLEPGLYVEGVGGIRIEHNYRITAAAHERLSHHEIALRCHFGPTSSPEKSHDDRPDVRPDRSGLPGGPVSDLPRPPRARPGALRRSAPLLGRQSL